MIQTQTPQRGRRALLHVAAVAVAAVALASTGLLTIPAAAQAPDPGAALSGAWKLNVDASENPNGNLEQFGGRAGRGGGGGRGGGMSGPPPGGDLGREEMARFTEQIKMFHAAPPLLGIQASAKEVLLALDPDPAKGMAYKHTTDNKKMTLPTAAGPIEFKVKWNGNVLHREINTKESLKLVEEYTVSADGKQLTVKIKTSNIMVRMDKIDITRVYDKVQ